MSIAMGVKHTYQKKIDRRKETTLRKSNNPQIQTYKKEKIEPKKNHINKKLTLEDELKGKNLNKQQLKNKEIFQIELDNNKLETERITLSEYLHHKGFTYKSQAELLTVKYIHKQMIKYLISIFLEEDENPILDETLDKGVIKIISNTWEKIKNILRITEIEPEKATLNLVKTFGCTYENIIIFLKLFKEEKKTQYDEYEKKYYHYEELRYPHEKKEFIKDILEIAKGGHKSLMEFIKTFVVRETTLKTEWEEVNEQLWENIEELIDEKIHLEGETVKTSNREWIIISDNNSDLIERKIIIESKEKKGIKKELIIDRNKKEIVEEKTKNDTDYKYKEKYKIKHPHINETIILKQLIKCMKISGGLRNKQAFINSLIKKEVMINGKMQTLLKFLTTKEAGGIEIKEAIQLLGKTIGTDGGSRNKDKIIECINNEEIELNGNKVSLYLFLKSKDGAGLNAKEAVKVITTCLSHNGGEKNKQALIDALNKPEVEINGKAITLYSFITNQSGTTITGTEAISAITRCISKNGGAKNKEALMESSCKPEIKIANEYVTLIKFLCLEKEANLTKHEALELIIKCISNDSGSKNKKAFIECIIKKEISLYEKKLSLYEFLKSEKGGGMNAREAILAIARCISHNGGTKNKEAFIDALIKPEITVNEKKVSLYEFLTSNTEGNLNSYQAVQILAKIISTIGGSKNKQAFINCIKEKKIRKGEKEVSLYEFLTSNEVGCIRKEEAINIIIKCNSHHGGILNSEALIECLSKKEIMLDDEMVTTYEFLTSKAGGGLSKHEAIEIITKCIGRDGGKQNKQALIECFKKKDINIKTKKVTLYTFLVSKDGAQLDKKDAIELIGRCIWQTGGSKNKEAIISCLSKETKDENGENKTLFELLKSKKDQWLNPKEAMQIIGKLVAHGGGSQNNEAFIECITKPEVYIKGRKVTIYTLLCSEEGGKLNPSEALQIIIRCVSHNGGSKNKKALIECFNKEEVVVNGQKSSIYEFLTKTNGSEIGTKKAIEIIIKCIARDGGSKNKEALLNDINTNIVKIGEQYKTFLEIILTTTNKQEEAIFICLLMSIKRNIINKKDLIELFKERKKDGNNKSVIKELEKLGIGTYRTILNIITSILSDQTSKAQTKKKHFKNKCQAITDMIMDDDSYINKLKKTKPEYNTRLINNKIVDACISYSENNINKEIKKRENMLVNTINTIDKEYQLTSKGIAIITTVKKTEELEKIIKLWIAEIGIRKEKPGSGRECEEKVRNALKIGIEKGYDTIETIDRYKELLFQWFDLGQLTNLMTKVWSSTKLNKSIDYFFKNMNQLETIMTNMTMKNRFILYMGLSRMIHHLERPLKIKEIEQFFKIIRIEKKGFDLETLQNEIYPAYEIYKSIPHENRDHYLQKITDSIPNIFKSYAEFKNKYQNKMNNQDWIYLIKIINNWNIQENNIKNEDFNILTKIGYEFPTELNIQWTDYNEIEMKKEGYMIRNKTNYPNWVFAIAYEQKIRKQINYEESWMEKIKEVKETNEKKYKKHNKINKFDIELYNDGFILKKEDINTMTFFYRKYRIEKYMEMQNISDIEETYNRKRKGNTLENEEPIKKQIKYSNSEINIEHRKRVREEDNEEQPKTKERKCIAEEDIATLYKTIEKENILTQKDCEIFLEGKRFLSDTMKEILAEKYTIIEFGNEELEKKWEELINNTSKKKEEKEIEETLWSTLNERILWTEPTDSQLLLPQIDIDYEKDSEVNDDVWNYLRTIAIDNLWEEEIEDNKL